MSGSSSVPAIQWTFAGIVAPAESAILSGVMADINSAFGGDMNMSLSTPQGQLATTQAAIIADKNSQIAYLVNMFDPATSSGRWQDGLGKLYFLDRLPAVSTAVQVRCSGLTGVVIPVGALVLDASGNQYACTQAGTIPAGGYIDLPFAAVQTGPIACPAGAITTVYRAVVGWDSATNPADGTPGRDVENRADFEYRRQQSVAKNGAGSLPAVYAEVFAVDGVLDLYATQNVTDSPVTVGAVTLAPHSIYVCAAGGVAADVAAAIWRKTSIGCNYNGNTTATVTDTSGYSVPYPAYQIKFQTPAALPIYFSVTVQNLGTASNATVEANIKAAIMSAFAGGDGGARARIGATIYATRYYAPVASAGTLAILTLFVGAAAAPAGTVVNVGIDQQPTLSAGNITVTFV